MSNGVNFNAAIGGNVNVNAGDGQQAVGDFTNIEGDQLNAGVISQGDNATIDASGQVVNFADTPERPNAGLFDAIRAQFPDDGEEPTDNVGLLDIPTLPEMIVRGAKKNAMPLPTPDDYQITSVANLSGLQLIDAWEEQSELPEEEQNPGLVAAIVNRLPTYAPRVGRGILAAGEAYLQTKVKTSSVVSAGIAFLSTLRD